MAKTKVVQFMSEAQIEAGLKMSIRERLQFVEDFMALANVSQSSKSKLISLKVPEDLLRLFRQKCEMEGVAYQTQIKKLMSEWTLKK
jgi:predicted DNA binding CopG/RHH family protein